MSAILLVLACADAESPPSSYRSYCIGLCRRLASCQPGFDLPSCFESCGSNPTLGVTNEALYPALAECVESQSCAALLVDATYEACYTMAVSRIVPSSTCVDFCLTDVAASFECGGGYSIERCLAGGVCAWHDDVLGAAAACNEESDCDARVACQEAAFGAP